jgi:hypothetical protein
LLTVFKSTQQFLQMGQASSGARHRTLASNIVMKSGSDSLGMLGLNESGSSDLSMGMGSQGSFGRSRRARFPSFGSEEWFQEDLDFDLDPAEGATHIGYERCRGGALLARQRAPSVMDGAVLVPQAYHKTLPVTGGNADVDGVDISGRAGIALLLSALTPPKAPPPQDVLESPLDAQLLWHATAGRREPQPREVRELVSQLWSKNLRESACALPPSRTGGGGAEAVEVGRDCVPRVVALRGGGSALQLFAGPGLHSSTVSKSFHMRVVPPASFSATTATATAAVAPPAASVVLTMTLQVPKFRVLRLPPRRLDCGAGPLRAEFLVVVSLGEGSDSVTLGIWQRYSDFRQLALRLQERCVRLSDRESLANTLVSWQCVEARRHWGRCVDVEYLALKCHLLERFLHDLLFESADPGDVASLLGLGAEALRADPAVRNLLPGAGEDPL